MATGGALEVTTTGDGDHGQRTAATKPEVSVANFVAANPTLAVASSSSDGRLLLFHTKWRCLPVLDTAPTKEATPEEVHAYNKHSDDKNTATCVMLAAMSLELQKQHEGMDAYTTIFHLKELYDEQSRTEWYETSKKLYRCMMAEGSSVSAHVLKMIGYIEKINQLGYAMDHELSIDLVLQSLPDSFS
ncbi:Retrotransposon protein [Abeliophyllum distichum]|uniref:Retrotransposon protein n=1 Tax=Abeliophyllum distichum TaxID=126358 RepID=A0ABD1RZU9_9LAMI